VRGKKGVRHGVAAVIDKDLTSAHMANVLGIPVMMILTAVKQVAVNFGQADQQLLEQVTLREIRQHQRDGHFPEGSMGPKIDAAVRFVEGGGQRVIIAHIDDAMLALQGGAGTHIVTDNAGL
jgi:carbamate kinase